MTQVALLQNRRVVYGEGTRHDNTELRHTDCSETSVICPGQWAEFMDTATNKKYWFHPEGRPSQMILMSVVSTYLCSSPVQVLLG